MLFRRLIIWIRVCRMYSSNMQIQNLFFKTEFYFLDKSFHKDVPPNYYKQRVHLKELFFHWKWWYSVNDIYNVGSKQITILNTKQHHLHVCLVLQQIWSFELIYPFITIAILSPFSHKNHAFIFFSSSSNLGLTANNNWNFMYWNLLKDILAVFFH